MSWSEAELKRMNEDNKAVCRRLRKVGIEVNSVWDLVNRVGIPEKSVPILIEFLGKDLHSSILEGVVRALGEPALKGIATGPMLDLYDRLAASEDMADDPHKGGICWAIGNAMLRIGDASSYDRILGIVKNRKHGTARQEFVIWLGKAKKRRAESLPVLRSLLKQKGVQGQALIAIRKLKAIELRADVERMLDSDSAWVKKEAKKTLAVFDSLPED